MCGPGACLVYTEVKRGRQIPWEPELQMGAVRRVLEIEGFKTGKHKCPLNWKLRKLTTEQSKPSISCCIFYKYNQRRLLVQHKTVPLP